MAPARVLHLDVTLASGDRISGSAGDPSLTFATNRGRVRIPLSRVRSIDGNGDQETVTLRTIDHEVTKAVLETGTLDVVPTGEETSRSISTMDVRALRVTPRIRLAGSGDAWWDLAFVRVLDWDAENPEGRLVVHSIDPATVNVAGHGPWSTVKLSRDVTPRDDFDLDAAISWDAGEAGPMAMACLYVNLYDARGNEIAQAGHHDCWSATTGSRYSRIDGAVKETGYDTLPTKGRLAIRITRSAGLVRVLFDGREDQACAVGAAVARIVVELDYYPYCGVEGRTVLGTATIEKLEFR